MSMDRPPTEEGPLLVKAEAFRPKTALAYVAPQTNPLSWTIINSGLLVWSSLLLYQILATSEGAVQRPNGQEKYMAWSLVTTAIWCVEIGLTVLYQGNAATWPERIELMLAVIFLVYTIIAMEQFSDPEEDIKEEVIDVSLSALSYAWIFYATAKNLWSPETSQDSGEVSMALENQTTRDNSTVVEIPYVQENFIEPENGGLKTEDTAITSQNAAGDGYAANAQHPQSTVALDSHSLPSQQIKNTGQTKKKGKWRLLNLRSNGKQTKGQSAENNSAVDHVV